MASLGWRLKYFPYLKSLAGVKQLGGGLLPPPATQTIAFHAADAASPSTSISDVNIAVCKVDGTSETAIAIGKTDASGNYVVTIPI